jgi:hypothetical protein
MARANLYLECSGGTLLAWCACVATGFGIIANCIGNRIAANAVAEGGAPKMAKALIPQIVSTFAKS